LLYKVVWLVFSPGIYDPENLSK